MTFFSKLFKKKEAPPKKNYKTGYNKLAYAASQQTYELDNYDNKYHKYLESQNYKLDEELSKDTRHKVYHNPESKHSIVAFKGTTSYDDILTDLESIGLNDYEHKDFKYAYNVYDKVKERYGDNISTSGHSLGGSLADRVAAKNDKKAIVFNPGSGPLGFKTSDKTQVYRKQDDQVSKYVSGKNIENLPEKKTVTYGNNSNLGLYVLNQLDSHTLQNFDDDFF